MENQVHLLNGDGLLQQMKDLIEGEKIVCRECLVEGDLLGATPDDFFENRAVYLFRTYKASIPAYIRESQQELERLKTLGEGCAINLWFEDDLFCQCNFWFVCHLLVTWKIEHKVYLVRPAKNHEYSFGSLPPVALPACLDNRIKIGTDTLLLLQKLWLAYVASNTSEMIALAQEMHALFPFLGPAVLAHISYALGIPEKSLRQIISDLQSNDFALVFQEFCKREAIYGLGDLQVKRMFDKITKRDHEQ